MKFIVFVYYKLFNIYIKKEYSDFLANFNAFISFGFIIIANLFVALISVQALFNIKIINFFVHGDVFSNRIKIFLAIAPIYIIIYITYLIKKESILLYFDLFKKMSKEELITLNRFFIIYLIASIAILFGLVTIIILLKR